MPSMMSRRVVRHILDLTRAEKREFLNSFDNIFSDCDGVVWELMKPIDGAGEAVNRLKKGGKKFVFITNNSVRTDEGYKAKFAQANIDVDLEHLIHPAKAVVHYLKKIQFDGLIYCVAINTFKEVLRNAGYKVIDGPNKILEESFTELARNVFDDEPVRAVIIDVDFNLSAPKLIRAGRYLAHPDCIYIGGATDMMLPVGRDVDIIGPGPYIKLVAEAAKKEPTILGKPGKELGNMLKERYKIEDPKRTLFIGDMLEQDIGFGRANGFQTLAVLTGGTKLEHFQTHPKEYEIPDYYADSLKDFLKFLDDVEKADL